MESWTESLGRMFEVLVGVCCGAAVGMSTHLKLARAGSKWTGMRAGITFSCREGTQFKNCDACHRDYRGPDWFGGIFDRDDASCVNLVWPEWSRGRIFSFSSYVSDSRCLSDLGLLSGLVSLFSQSHIAPLRRGGLFRDARSIRLSRQLRLARNGVADLAFGCGRKLSRR
jgi:hypothetical protein